MCRIKTSVIKNVPLATANIILAMFQLLHRVAAQSDTNKRNLLISPYVFPNVGTVILSHKMSNVMTLTLKTMTDVMRIAKYKKILRAQKNLPINVVCT